MSLKATLGIGIICLILRLGIIGAISTGAELGAYEWMVSSRAVLL